MEQKLKNPTGKYPGHLGDRCTGLGAQKHFPSLVKEEIMYKSVSLI